MFRRIAEHQRDSWPIGKDVSLCDVIRRCLTSELNGKDEWSWLRYVEQFDPFTAVSYNVEKIRVNEFPPRKFIEKYERLYKPVVKRICDFQGNWRQARQKATKKSHQLNHSRNKGGYLIF